MSEKINPEEVADYIKLLVETAGTHNVDENYTIISSKSGRPVTISDNRDEEGSRIKIFHSEMKPGDYLTLNPFANEMTSGIQMKYFWNVISAKLHSMTKMVIKRVIEANAGSLDDDDEIEDDGKRKLGLDAAELSSRFSGEVDKKTWEKMKDIKTFIWINYNRRQRTASLVIPCLEEKTTKDMKFRKKDQEFLRHFFEEVGFLPIEEWSVKSTTIGLTGAETRLTIFVRACEMLNPWTKAFLNVDLNVPDLQYGLDRIEEYHNACLWFSASAFKQKKSEKQRDVKPWDSSSIPDGSRDSSIPQQQAQQQPMQQVAAVPGSNIPANVIPVHYGGYSPGYGQGMGGGGFNMGQGGFGQGMGGGGFNMGQGGFGQGQQMQNMFGQPQQAFGQSRSNLPDNVHPC